MHAARDIQEEIGLFAGKPPRQVRTMLARPAALWLALVLPLLLIVMLVAWFDQAAARTAGFLVDTTFDTHDVLPGDGICADGTGDCSLRAAVEESNSLPGADTITLPAGSYHLVEGSLWISDTLQLSGAGPDASIISAQFNPSAITVERVGDDDPINVVLENVTVRDARDFSGEISGAIVSSENLSIQKAIIRDNLASNGAGVANLGGNLWVTDTLILDNLATGASGGSSGGGVYTEFGYTEILSSTIANNHADFGGGLSVWFGTMVVQGSTISGNTADSWAGGVLNRSGIITITLTLITSNASLSPSNAGGGAIRNFWDGKIWLVDSTVVENAAPNTIQSQAGGIMNQEGYIEISGTEISGNTGYGLWNSDFGTLVITGSTVSDNIRAFAGGGGILNSGVLTVTQSTISGNANSGLVLLGTSLSDSRAFIGNSTISGNRSPGYGGGIYASSDDPVTITHSTIAFNFADSNLNAIGDGGGIYRDDPSGPVTVRNTLIAHNADGGGEGPDCAGLELNSLGYNLVTSLVGCAFTPSTGDLLDVSFLLGVLSDWGGPTHTHALLPGTAPTNTGICTDPSGSPVLQDQRGVSRPQGAACDIGAYEDDGSANLVLLFLPIVIR